MIKNLSLSLFLIVIVSLMFPGCDEPADMDKDPAGDEMTVQERMSVLDRCVAKANELNNLVSIEDRMQMLNWLTTEPGFGVAGFAGEQLFAVFKDDRVFGKKFF